jgi:hypothetical protein
VGQVGRLPVLGGCWLLLGLVSVGFAFATSFEVLQALAPSRARRGRINPCTDDRQ